MNHNSEITREKNYCEDKFLVNVLITWNSKNVLKRA